MLSFKSFLLERKRTRGQAIKLLQRVARMKKFGGGEQDDAIHAPFKPHHRTYAGFDKYKPHQLDPKRNKEYRPNSVELQRDYKFSHHQKIPIKAVHAMQDRVSVSNTERILNKPSSDRKAKRPKVIANRHGTFDVADGHHHMTAARFRGEKHIEVEVHRRRKTPEEKRKLDD